MAMNGQSTGSSHTRVASVSTPNLRTIGFAVNGQGAGIEKKNDGMAESDIGIRAFVESDLVWAVPLLERDFASSTVVSRGHVIDAAELPGIVAVREDEPVGLATYRLNEDDCEMVSLNSVVENIGAGTALIEAVATAATATGCRRLWLITTNDNLHALRFYQKRGFSLAALYPKAVDQSRALKDIPRLGADGIPIRDEIELGLWL